TAQTADGFTDAQRSPRSRSSQTGGVRRSRRGDRAHGRRLHGCTKSSKITKLTNSRGTRISPRGSRRRATASRIHKDREAHKVHERVGEVLRWMRATTGGETKVPMA